MISYASVDRMEGKFVVCEVELIDIENSKTTSFAEKETIMLDVSMDIVISKIQEGDVIIVEHDGKNVVRMCGKDEEEKLRRIKLLRAIIGK